LHFLRCDHEWSVMATFTSMYLQYSGRRLPGYGYTAVVAAHVLSLQRKTELPLDDISCRLELFVPDQETLAHGLRRIHLGGERS
jgi:hypothetical protein